MTTSMTTRRLSAWLVGAAVLLASSPAAASSYVVTSATGDPGEDDGVCDAECSIREAIAAANAEPGTGHITFRLEGAPPHVIELREALLPPITDRVTLDGTNGPDGEPVILEGSALPQDDPATDCLTHLYENPSGNGMFGKPGANSALLHLQGPGADRSEIRDLHLSIAVNDAAALNGLESTSVPYIGEGNPFITFVYDARQDGELVVRGPCAAVTVAGSDDNLVEGVSVDGFLMGNAALIINDGYRNTLANNTVAGDVNDGIEVGGGAENRIVGNRVVADLMIQSEGIGIFSRDNLVEGNHVGGATNNISASYGSNGNVIRGNHIDSGGNGVLLQTCCGLANEGNLVVANTITGTQTGIAMSLTPLVGDAPVARNTLSRNVIEGLGLDFRSSFMDHEDWDCTEDAWGCVTDAKIGIDIGLADWFDWPWADGIGAAPPFTAAPELTSAVAQHPHLEIRGQLSGGPDTSYRLEFFTNRTAALEAHVFAGSRVVTTDGEGEATFAVRFPRTPDDALYITATATEIDDERLLGTSELALPLPIETTD